jgi:hypothetical protein
MRIKLKGIYRNRKRLADGSARDYWSLRGVGPLNPLSGDEQEEFSPGSPAFMRAYNKLIEAPRQARTTGTMRAIIAGYQRSPAWTKRQEQRPTT